MTGLTTSDSSQSATHVYAYNGDRLSRTLNGTTWKYLYSKEDILTVAQPGGTLTLTQGPGIDDVLAETLDGTPSYAYKNMLSSVVSLADTAGTVTRFYPYDAWGNTMTWPDPATDPNPYGYTGREWDARRVYYFRTTSLVPGSCRFLSHDPIHGVFQLIRYASLEQNPYLYAWNNPIHGTDPFGLDTWVGGTLNGGFFAGLGGLSWGGGTLKNLTTGESCVIKIKCWHIGIGAAVIASANPTATTKGPHCGWGLNGVTHGVGTNVYSALWDQNAPPTNRAGSYSGGVGPPLGLFGGYHGCVTEVTDCANTPCECR